MFQKFSTFFGATFVILGVAGFALSFSGCEKKPTVTRGDQVEIQQHQARAQQSLGDTVGLARDD